MAERITSTDVTQAVETLRALMNRDELHVSAWTPGDRYGTRYVVSLRDGESGVLFRACGAREAHRMAFAAIRTIEATLDPEEAARRWSKAKR